MGAVEQYTLCSASATGAFVDGHIFSVSYIAQYFLTAILVNRGRSHRGDALSEQRRWRRTTAEYTVAMKKEEDPSMSSAGTRRGESSSSSSNNYATQMGMPTRRMTI